MPELSCHPLALEFDCMDPTSFDSLKASLLKHGQVDDIWVDPAANQIIDGCKRHRALLELGITPRLREWKGEAGTIEEFIWVKNWERLHLTPSQRAMRGARRKRSMEEAEKENCANLRAKVKNREKAAKAEQVSPRSVEFGEKVLAQGTQELVKAVDSGKIAVSKAADIAELPAAEQAARIRDAENRSVQRRMRDAREERISQIRRLQGRSLKLSEGLGGEAEGLIDAHQTVIRELDKLLEV